jgi:hypothetical protein
LTLYDFANRIILERSEVLLADFGIFESSEGSAKLRRGREAADLIDPHITEVLDLRIIRHVQTPQSMIPKSVQRFSDKIMLKQEARAG